MTYRDAPETNIPDFKQADPRWRDIIYSSHGDAGQTIYNGGCALCALANVLSGLVGDVSPPELIPLALKLGDVAWTGGTYRAFYLDITQFYPVTVARSENLDDATACLDAGGLVIVSMDHHAHTLYAHTGDDYWLFNSAWSDPLLSQIMGHMTYDRLFGKAAVYYCYQRSMP